jgi:hypothetical protein
MWDFELGLSIKTQTLVRVVELQEVLFHVLP